MSRSIEAIADEVAETFGTLRTSRREISGYLTAEGHAPDVVASVLEVLEGRQFWKRRRGGASPLPDKLLAEAERCVRAKERIPTMRELARRAGVASAAPYSHFPDRRAFLDALSKRVRFTWRNIEL